MSETDALIYRRYLDSNAPGLDRRVKIGLADDAGWSHSATLDFLDNQIDRSSGTLHARATMPNHDLLITPGQFARVQVPMSAPQPVMLVPDSAIVTDQSQKMVMVASADGAVTPKPVELGALDGDTLRVIKTGLSPDDEVIIIGLMRLRPGARVSPHPGSIEPVAAQ